MFLFLDSDEPGVDSVSLHLHYSRFVAWSWFRHDPSLEVTSRRSGRVCSTEKQIIEFLKWWCTGNLLRLFRSERVSKSGVDGQLLSEAKYINLSLHFLEQVSVCLYCMICVIVRVLLRVRLVFRSSCLCLRRTARTFRIATPWWRQCWGTVWEETVWLPWLLRCLPRRKTSM